LISGQLDGDQQKGLSLCREQNKSSPQVRVVVLLESSKEDLVVETFRAGAKGVFFRAASARPLAKCIHSVYNGQIWAGSRELGFLLGAFSESSAFRMLNPAALALLSQREHQVVRCVAEGLSNRQIADRLKLSEHTIKNYIFRIFEKLGMSSRVELIVYAMKKFSLSENDNCNGRKNLDCDHAALARWYRGSIEDAPGVMQYRLADMYRTGLGVPHDRVSAYVWFALAEVECYKVRKQSLAAKRDLVLEMTSEQIEEAERRAADLIAKLRKRPSPDDGSSRPATLRFPLLPEASGA
jgi:DNA-binding NarL/FixJ family response regulator